MVMRHDPANHCPVRGLAGDVGRLGCRQIFDPSACDAHLITLFHLMNGRWTPILAGVCRIMSGKVTERDNSGPHRRLIRAARIPHNCRRQRLHKDGGQFRGVDGKLHSAA
jgi:hypothetical protein